MTSLRNLRGVGDGSAMRCWLLLLARLLLLAQLLAAALSLPLRQR